VPASNCTSASPFIPVDQAIALEGLRQQLAPLLAAAEANGIPRNEVVLAWTFTISNRAFTVYDPTAQRIPFPNDILRDPTTGKVNLPINPDDPVAMNNFKAELNQLTGFSTTGGVLAQVDLPPGDALVPDTSAVVTTVQPSTIIIRGGNIFIQQTRPLAPEKQFLNVVTTRLVDTAGNPVEPAPLMVFLRSTGPLFDGTHSTVAELSDAEAQQLEPLRMATGQALDLAGIPRQNVILAWGFTTEPTVSVLQSRIAGLPSPSSMGAPITIPPGIPQDKISQVISGTFVGSKGGPVPTLLILPTATPRGLVIFQHGFPSDKNVVFAIANTFATLGLATASMDLPFSGDRTVQGKSFLDLTDVGATRENLLEASADMAQLVRTTSTPGLFGHTFTGAPLIVGESAGGFVATNYSAITPPARLVQSTSGAPIVDIALTSPTFAPLYQQVLAGIGITPGTPQFDQFVYFARMELDAGDPINYAGLISPARTPVLAQVAPNDQVIPAQWGRTLGAASQARIVLLPANAGHGALINPQDPAIATAQAQVAAFLGGGEP
jgi:pimeloyl-ACP methyl ester carboxylesterase